jgi:hypothetical protein
MLFADLAGFTRATHGLPPEDVSIWRAFSTTFAKRQAPRR